ncbi:MAG: N-acetylmuramoyl-L-alanine amidase [Muribaculum sp.]|nr:N-acetylmuramoyl-L-alanine amidase [Muribaculaceae bacterium]MCM1080510.1 N-acetylmuramoyl-L-alanine amidase [Muribaculum sp.]
MKIIIDNGHGAETAGKRSPDGSVLEYAYTRQMAAALASQLKGHNLEPIILVPELTDVPLAKRVRRANAITDSALLVSLHLNAAGSDNRWHSASGFSCYVSQNASHASRRLAAMLTAEAQRHSLTGNRIVPPDKVWVQNLAICRDTRCPAVLTESLFMDNVADVAYLLSAEGFNRLISVHLNAILNYV